ETSHLPRDLFCRRRHGIPTNHQRPAPRVQRYAAIETSPVANTEWIARPPSVVKLSTAPKIPQGRMPSASRAAALELQNTIEAHRNSSGGTRAIGAITHHRRRRTDQHPRRPIAWGSTTPIRISSPNRNATVAPSKSTISRFTASSRSRELRSDERE